jgi:hypothetical protein
MIIINYVQCMIESIRGEIQRLMMTKPHAMDKCALYLRVSEIQCIIMEREKLGYMYFMNFS